MYTRRCEMKVIRFLMIFFVFMKLISIVVGLTDEICSPNKTQSCIERETDSTDLRSIFDEWKQSMRQIDITTFKFNKTDEPVKKKFSLLKRCLADTSNVQQIKDNGNEKIKHFQFLPGNVCHDNFEINSAKLNSFGEADEFSGLAEFISDDLVFHAPLEDGAINGLFRVLRCENDGCLADKNTKISEAATFVEELKVMRNGYADPNYYGWSFPIDYGGALYCKHNILRKAEGDECVYLYPDIKSGIVGTWRDGLMVTGRPAILKRFILHEGFLKPIMEIVEGREEYTFFEATENAMTPDSMLSDIYEDLNLFMAPSTIPYAGEGVFALTLIRKGDLVAAYNGVKFSVDQKELSNERRSSRYSVGTWDNQSIDIPMKYQSRENYVASLGHKVNHSENNNAEYKFCEHPRFGDISCVVAKRDIEAGEEIFTNYGKGYWSRNTSKIYFKNYSYYVY